MPKIGIGGTGNIDSVQMDEQGSTPSTPATGKSAIFLKSDGLYVIDDAGAVTGPLVASAGGGYTEGARVYNTANISISNTTLTPLTFDSERYDTDGIHDTGSNTGRLTCQTSGKYIITANVQFASNTSGFRQIRIVLNGSTIIGFVQINDTPNADVIEIVSTIYDLTATDYVEVVVYQNSGVAINVTTGANYSPEFMMQRIG